MFDFLLLSFKGSLYILDNSPLSDVLYTHQGQSEQRVSETLSRKTSQRCWDIYVIPGNQEAEVGIWQCKASLDKM
jgi:hypothetical protein